METCLNPRWNYFRAFTINNNNNNSVITCKVASKVQRKLFASTAFYTILVSFLPIFQFCVSNAYPLVISTTFWDVLPCVSLRKQMFMTYISLQLHLHLHLIPGTPQLFSLYLYYSKLIKREIKSLYPSLTLFCTWVLQRVIKLKKKISISILVSLFYTPRDISCFFFFTFLYSLIIQPISYVYRLNLKICVLCLTLPFFPQSFQIQLWFSSKLDYLNKF